MCVCATKVYVREMCVTMLCVIMLCVCDNVVCERVVCERVVFDAEEAAADGGRWDNITKNKNPTQRCGEKRTHKKYYKGRGFVWGSTGTKFDVSPLLSCSQRASGCGRATSRWGQNCGRNRRVPTG